MGRRNAPRVHSDSQERPNIARTINLGDSPAFASDARLTSCHSSGAFIKGSGFGAGTADRCMFSKMVPFRTEKWNTQLRDIAKELL